MQSFGTKHSFCHKLLLQKEIRKKEILLKPLNMERHHHKFCVCLFCMLKCKVTTMVLALFAGRNCFYARCMTFFTSLCDVKTSLTYVTMYVGMWVVPSFCSTNFGALLLYEREGWVQIDEHRYWTPGQAWFTQIGIKLLAYVSPEKIAFPCEVFLKFCLIFVYHTFCISPSFEGNTYLWLVENSTHVSGDLANFLGMLWRQVTLKC